MKKKYVKYIIIGAIALLIFYTVCITGYLLLRRYLEVGEFKLYCEEIQVILQEDDTFESRYGEVISVTLDETRQYSILDKSRRLIPCIIETNTNDKYSVWVEYDVIDFVAVVQYDSITSIVQEDG